MRSVFVFAAVTVALGSHHLADQRVTAAEERACAGCPVCREGECRRENGWSIIETDNFSVWTRLTPAETRKLACACEAFRGCMLEDWLEEGEATEWRPKCAVVVHADLNQYRGVVACGRNPSVGCTTITTDGGRTVFRRIDLRADAADWNSNALPHELTHVVIADCFPGETLPAWLNEGLAMSAESRELQQRRLRVLERARTTDALPKLEHVLQADAAAAGRLDVDLFYAVSFSLVDFLRQEGGTGRLLQFAEHSLDKGYPTALRRTYAIHGGVEELEQRWLDEALSPPISTGLAAQ